MSDAKPIRFTRRETEILALCKTGMSNAEIAKRLFVSKRTIDFHYDHMRQKCGAGDRMEMIAAIFDLALKPNVTLYGGEP